MAHSLAGQTFLDAYKHAEYFEAVARMAWEANQGQVSAEAYSEDIVDCILREFNANRNQDTVEPITQIDQEQDEETPQNLYNYP